VANSGVTQPRIECFEALVTHIAVLCIPRFGVSKHWRCNSGVMKPRTECFKALLTPTAVLGILGFRCFETPRGQQWCYAVLN